MKKIFLALIAALTVWSTAAEASSCYDLPAVTSLRRYASQAPRTEVTFLIDQTVSLPEEAKVQLLDQMARFATAGTIVDIGSFSSLSGATFPAIETRIVFEAGIPIADEVKVSRRARDLLKVCLAYRQRAGLEAAQRALRTRFAVARPTIGQSDIMSSLQQFSGYIASAPARERIVFIASDMIENSSTSSFYQQGKLRAIDPDRELRRAADHRLFANFGHAKIYVVGMATQPVRSQGTTPVETVQRLEQFWAEYFRRSNSGQVLFGKPVLLRGAY